MTDSQIRSAAKRILTLASRRHNMSPFARHLAAYAMGQTARKIAAACDEMDKPNTTRGFITAVQPAPIP